MKITSKDNSIVKELEKLFNDKKYRDSKELYIVEGYHLVEEANKAHVLKDVYSIKEELNYPNAIIITEEILKKITNTVTPQGIIGVVKKNNDLTLNDKILYLDRVQDPGNIGTLLRSALAFGFKSVILDECCDIYNPKVVRSSEGAIFNLSFPKCKLNELTDYDIVSTSMNGFDSTNYKFDQGKICLVLGNEGSGVRKEYQEMANINLTIPMEKIESLNVGVAGSILMYEIKKNER